MNAELLDLHKIWDQAPHNALTDLIRFEKAWFCVFREGEDHISPDGKIRILTSEDGLAWKPGALLSIPGSDLRDPKITVTPWSKLMINAAAAYDPAASVRHQSLVWFSRDGIEWSPPEKIGDPNFWLWRIAWRGDLAYSVGYSTVRPLITRLYLSRDGITFEPVIGRMFSEGFPNEAAIAFEENGRAICLQRRDAEGAATAQLGLAHPPYHDWNWKDLGVRIGGPQILPLPDGRIVAAIRRYGKEPWTSLNWLDPADGRISEFLALPSGGDNSYAGLCWYRDVLWVSYYSSHERRTSIYLAQVRIPQ
jgi:hypothetical protein